MAADAGEEQYKAMEKALGEPFGMEYQEDVLKTRRNLLVGGATSLLIWAAGLRLKEGGDGGPTAPFLGWPLTGMTHQVLLWCLVVAICYLLLHFVWGSLDAIQEYRLRRTGARVRFQTGSTMGTEGIDAPIHPRQATLYSWWVQSSRRIERTSRELDEREKHLAIFVDALKGLQSSDVTKSRDLHHVIDLGNKAIAAVGDLKSHIEEVGRVMSNERLTVSLRRFDEAFTARAMSQNARWLILEFGLPVVLGVCGVLAALAQIFPRWWVFW